MAEYAYVCDKKQCEHCQAKFDESAPCTHTTDPLHSLTLSYGLKPIFEEVASGKFYEIGQTVWNREP